MLFERQCQLKDLFGEPGEGAHAYRIPFLNWAAIDVLLTIALAYVVARLYYKQQPSLKQVVVAFALIMLIVPFIHWYFCVPTALNVSLGLAQ